MNFSSIGYISAFILGAFHTLEPGHGKSILAAYMVSNEVKWKNLALIIGSIFLTHFTLLFVIAFLLKYYHFENIHFIQDIAPVFIILFGVYLLVKNYYNNKKHKDHEHTCSCDGFHNKTKGAGLGLLTGLIPCPTVLSPIFLAFQSGQFEHIFSYLFMYVVGMTLTMTLILLFVMKTKKFAEKKLAIIQSHINIHVLSAVIIIAVGLIYTVLNLLHHH